MNKRRTNSRMFGALRLLDEFATAEGLDFSDQHSLGRFLARMSDAVTRQQQSPIVVHGFRAQTMFAYIAASLGACKLITEEDSGDFYTTVDEIERPDYRIVTNSGEEFFIEVKNCFLTGQEKGLTHKAAYVTKLENYCRSFGKKLFFAVYWSKWKQWTLIPSHQLRLENGKRSISLGQAMMANHMAKLGDCMIGTTKPLVLRFFTDPKKDRSVDKNGNAGFTIGRTAFFSAGKEITDPFEQQLAWFFILYGNWEDIEHPAEIENGQLISFDIAPVRSDPNPEQLFQMVGSLSSMIARQFNDITTDQGKVLKLAPRVEPNRLGVVLPPNFHGDVLGVWRFTQEPTEPHGSERNPS